MKLNNADRQRLKNTLSKAASSVWGHQGNEWFRHKIRDSLLQQQGDRCCYCRRPLSNNRGSVEIDHIVHKGKKTGYPAFSFSLKNLAVSCKDCNNVKGRKGVLAQTGKVYVRYPSSPAAYVWVHPYLHTYSEHIEIYEGWVYKPVLSAIGPSENGKAVIEKCGLNKISQIEKANRMSKFEQAEDTGALIREALAQANHAGREAVAKDIAPLLTKAMGARATEALQLFEKMYDLTEDVLTAPQQTIEHGAVA
ncbi:HNH endonuclease [Paraburkholderia terrae]|uniref:HNH endonuclease n=1 Tax=Paraburkholderia terrae TaxID=311230 RepID=UPI0033653703